MTTLTIHHLPNEVLLKIFDSLTHDKNSKINKIRNLLQCSQVSQRWHAVVQDKNLWIRRWNIGMPVNPDQALKETVVYLKVFYKQDKENSSKEKYKEGLKFLDKKDAFFARIHFEKAAENGYLPAIRNLIPLLKGVMANHVPLGDYRRWEELKQLFEDAQKPNCPSEKISELGLNFLPNGSNRLLNPSLKKAILYLKKASRKGSLQARAALMEIQTNPDKEYPLGIEKKVELIDLDQLNRDAKLPGCPYPDKAYQMGLRFLGLNPAESIERCKKSEENEKKAVECFILAADNGHEKAKRLLDYYAKMISIKKIGYND
jgi:TPR repeat protein